MKIIIWLLTLLVISSVVYSQNSNKRFATKDDVTRDSSVRRTISKSCQQYLSYMPDTLHPEFTPMRMVRINIHVMQDGKGQNNFSEEEGTRFISQLVTNANNRLGSNKKMNLPKDNTTPVIPIPYRYVLTGDPKVPGDDGIYFHRDDTLYSMNKKSKRKDNVYDRRQYEKYGVQKDSVINIFMIEHNIDSLKSPTYKSSSDGVGTGAFAKLVGSYYLWKHPAVTEKGDTVRFDAWNLSGLMNHELGHCLGLSHTWEYDDGCDDTPKHAACWNFGPPPCEICSNNVMDYNAYQNAFSPCQIAKVVMNCYSDKTARRFLVPDWCTYNAAKSITIRQGEEINWLGAMDVFGDLIIENNATLTMHCTVSMAPGSKIILAPKATLILDGCLLTSRCSDQWQGIEISTTKKVQPSIIMKSGSVLENVKNPL